PEHPTSSPGSRSHRSTVPASHCYNPAGHSDLSAEQQGERMYERRSAKTWLMSVADLVAAPPQSLAGAPPPLENGDHLAREEFERRDAAMPHVKKAELLRGVVYMPSPVRIDRHAEQ